MANFINIYSDLAAYNADESKEYPNVSYLEVEDEVKWQATEPIDQEHIVAKYDVTSTSNPTKILNNTSNITYMEVDGVQQQSVSTGYTFSSTGTHKVKYKINSSWNGGNAFNSCSSLTSVTIPDSVTYINSDIFKNCSGLTSVHLPNSLTRIGDRAFQSCSGLTSVIIPNGVTSIGNDAFQSCTNLTSINIPSGVTSIGNQAFIGCNSLTSVTIPNNVTSIGYNAFFNCSSLASVTVKATTPPTMKYDVFRNTNNCPIYVPSASVNAYKTASGWSTYASRIQAIQ